LLPWQNSADSKILPQPPPGKFGCWQRSAKQNLAANAKIGPGSRKMKGTKVQYGNTDKSLPLTQFGANTKKFKSVKMIVYGG
jgi:hypothetical protein